MFTGHNDWQHRCMQDVTGANDAFRATAEGRCGRPDRQLVDKQLSDYLGYYLLSLDFPLYLQTLSHATVRVVNHSLGRRKGFRFA